MEILNCLRGMPGSAPTRLNVARICQKAATDATPDMPQRPLNAGKPQFV